MDDNNQKESKVSETSEETNQSDQTDESAAAVEDTKVTKQETKSEPEATEASQQTDSEKEKTSEPEKSEPDDASATDKPAAPQPKSDNPNARWYVVHTYSGHENKVSLTLKQRVESEHLEKKILDVLVPMQEKIEIKSGKKVNVKEKIFPGYILVKMVLDDISWLAVRTTQGVTSFVGMGNKPTPISDAEVQTIVKFTQSEAPMYKQVFAANDTVKIVDGPFADFIGKIDSVDSEKGKVRVLVSIFGRETPVELDFLQIKKI